MTVLYVAWQDARSRRWRPVGRLSLNGAYSFVYTKGVLEAEGFRHFGRMPDFFAEYQSPALFPLFDNLLLPKTRPEYRDFLAWLNLRENEADPLAMLALAGGAGETNSPITVFPRPERTAEGKFHVRFFSHGLSHCPQESQRRVAELRAGNRLLLLPDPQNPFDTCAVALRTDDQPLIVGYCPRYLSPDVLLLLEHLQQNRIRATVEQVNPDAPIQFRLLCSVTADWPMDFQPCSGVDYEPLGGQPVHRADMTEAPLPH